MNCEKINFKDWYLSTPDGAGEIWDNRANTDRDFGRSGARSKNVARDLKAEPSEFNPEKIFGKRKRSNKK